MSGLCEHCIQGYVLEGTPSGSFQGSAYFHPGPRPSKRAVVLLTDIFGLKLVNQKLLADEYSRRLECDVWCPDIFAGKPPFTESQLAPLLSDSPGTPISFLSKLKFVWTLILGLPGLIRNRVCDHAARYCRIIISSQPGVVDSRITTFVKQIRQEKEYEKIGAIGFCFGGAEVVRLGSAGLFESGVIAHPGRISQAQIQAITIPTSWICAEEDMAFGTKMRNEAEANLKAKKDAGGGAEYEFKDYKGTTHGFAARPNLGIPVVKKAFEDSVDQGVAWFDKTLTL